MQGEGYHFQLWSSQPTDIVVPFKRRYYSSLAGVCNKLRRNMQEMFKKLTLIRVTNASSIFLYYCLCQQSLGVLLEFLYVFF